MASITFSSLLFIGDPTSLRVSLPPPAVAAVDYSAIERAEQQTIDLFNDATQSVVFINTYFEKGNPVNLNVYALPTGMGSGFVWKQQGTVGYIVTNYHVVRNSNKALVTVKKEDGTSQTFLAAVRGVDPDKVRQCSQRHFI